MSEPEGRDLRMLDEQIGVAREALGVAVAHYRAAGVISLGAAVWIHTGAIRRMIGTHPAEGPTS